MSLVGKLNVGYWIANEAMLKRIYAKLILVNRVRESVFAMTSINLANNCEPAVRCRDVFLRTCSNPAGRPAGNGERAQTGRTERSFTNRIFPRGAFKWPHGSAPTTRPSFRLTFLPRPGTWHKAKCFPHAQAEEEKTQKITIVSVRDCIDDVFVVPRQAGDCAWERTSDRRRRIDCPQGPDFVAFWMGQRHRTDSSRSLDEETRSGETALYIAAEQGNEANVRLLLQAGANVSKIDFTKLVGMWSGYTDLHYMVRKIVRSAPAIFLGLLDKIDTSLLKDDTLLLRAARLGCDKPMKILIDAGLNVNCKDQLGQTPLHIAVRNDHPEVVKYLIDGGADVDCQDVNGRTPLHFCRQAEIFRQLISADAKVNLKDNDGNSVLHFAAQNKCTELVEHFVNEYPNDINCKNKFDKTALHIAVEYNHEVIVELLVNSNADINAVDIKGKSPIFSALKFTNKVRDFLKKDLFKRYFQQPDRYRAELAAFNWFRVVTVESLLNMGASIHVLDEQRRSLLHVAAKSGDNLGNYQAVKVLINAGLDVNAEDEQKNIPLHYACLKTGKCDIVSYLIEFSSNVNPKNAKGQTPLHLAITDNNSADVTKLLIVKRANLILADDDGNTPLHLAILYRKTEIALLLIDLLDKPSLNGRNNDEETALHVAVLQNNIAVVRKLTEKGVKLSLRTEYNKTAWDIAVDENRHEIIAYFKNKLNNVSIG
ncbi:ankyrin repeat domain-containing protein 44 [Culex quinquefasciatus]|uniref:Ankyrin repeat domain-containing protein 44 n=1 Tax=Culex quinquefasciatus TaxID=7176 RepID=B0WN52_CULQU|nr:ankyrin repeat domain-containing protein 44 [Culex quinquefasciatus]|eukprot:XP_001850136.1 ankyrin repeat domain-containing protein 44 [Culex quinquefasciatus]